MKLYFAVFLMVFIAPGFAQTGSNRPQSEAAEKPAPADARPGPIAADATVLTVQGVCKAVEKASPDCKTVVTRAEFERLMAVLSRRRSEQGQDSIPAEARRQLAIQYSRLLLYSDLAERQGLQNTEEGAELVRFARLQAMAEELARALQQRTELAPGEAKDFYDHHPERFTEWMLQRVMVPVNPRPGGQAQKDELRKFTESLRLRASRGADFALLQKEASAKTGITNMPEVRLVLTPGASLPEAFAAVSQLQAGGLSTVIEEVPGFSFYKVDSTRLIPFAQKEAEIRDLVAGQKAEQALQKLGDSASFSLNPYYFNPTHAAAITGKATEMPAPTTQTAVH